MSYNFERLRVLVVDDNLHSRALVGAVLHAFGVKTVLEAASAEGGWKKLTQNRCDLIFVDWVMDDMNRLELPQKIRTATDSPNQFVPIGMVTGQTTMELVHAAVEAAANEFLAKPLL